MHSTASSRSHSRKLQIAKRIAAGFVAVIIIGFLVPERLVIPVDGATVSDWNKGTFWYEPWGASGVHKGIDIFAPKGKDVIAASGGLVMYQGGNDLGGNVLLVLGPKWRLHYYAHMETSVASIGDFVRGGETIGTVGNSGNAAGKQSHLHFVILTIFPYPWLLDTGTQGWKKMFYLDPNIRLRAERGR